MRPAILNHPVLSWFSVPTPGRAANGLAVASSSTTLATSHAECAPLRYFFSADNTWLAPSTASSTAPWSALHVNPRKWVDINTCLQVSSYDSGSNYQ